MAAAVAGVIAHDIAPPEEALRMGSLYPARAAGVQDRLGKIARGWQADMVLLDDAYRVTETIVSGRT
jgi:N-acetylglucosamine-6-phosphate deacetylase